MRRCVRCGQMVDDHAKFCTGCGAALPALPPRPTLPAPPKQPKPASVAVPTSVPAPVSAPASHDDGQTDRTPAPFRPQYSDRDRFDGGSFWWLLLACCIPVVGIVLWLMWRTTKPETASRLRKGTIVGVVLWTVLGINVARMVQRRNEYERFSAWCTSLHYENSYMQKRGVVGRDATGADNCTLKGKNSGGGYAAIEDKAYVWAAKDYIRWWNGVCSSAPSYTRSYGCDYWDENDLFVQADGDILLPDPDIRLIYSDEPNQ